MLGFFFVVVVFLTLGINLSFKFLTFQAHCWLRMLKTEFNNLFLCKFTFHAHFSCWAFQL